MRLKRLAAVTLSMVMALTMTAYANDADAVAVYQEMEAKSNAQTDMDAYLDFKMDMSSGGEHAAARIEMNMKANNMTAPEQMQMNMYMRMTVLDAGTSETGTVVGPGEADPAVDLSGSSMTANIYYADGMYYMDMLGGKLKMPVPLGEMMESIKQTTGMMSTSLDYVQNLKLRTEGEDRILSFTMDASKMNNLLVQMMDSMQSMTSGSGVGVSYRDISCEYVVNPEGYCTKTRMKMTMDVAAGEDSMTMTLDGDVGYANPGQPVTVPVPNLGEYTLAGE